MIVFVIFSGRIVFEIIRIDYRNYIILGVVDIWGCGCVFYLGGVGLFGFSLEKFV